MIILLVIVGTVLLIPLVAILLVGGLALAVRRGFRTSVALRRAWHLAVRADQRHPQGV